jgi:acyl-CoA thioesterase-1
VRRRRVGPGSIVAFVIAALAVAAILGAAFLQQRSLRSSVAAPEPSTTVTTRPVAVFIGDSYSAGVGATAIQKRWVNRVAYAEGWTLQNLAQGGTGYAIAAGRAGCGKDFCPPYRGVLDQVRSLHPQVVVVSGGRNDLADPDATIDSAIRSFYPALRAAAPNATIYATSPIWDDSVAPTRLTRLGPIVQQAVQAVGGTYLDIGEPLRGSQAYVIGDSIHPSDLGHGRIADAVTTALRKR